MVKGSAFQKGGKCNFWKSQTKKLETGKEKSIIVAQGNITDLVNLDFSKAFHKVSYIILENM